MYQYDFKNPEYKGLIQKLIPRQMYIDVITNKQGLPTLYVSCKPGTQILSIFMREQQSSVKIPEKTLQRWADQLIDEAKTITILNPRLDYVYLDSQTGSVYFDIPAYLPPVNIEDKFNKAFEPLTLSHLNGQAQMLASWLESMQSVYYGTEPVPSNFDDLLRSCSD